MTGDPTEPNGDLTDDAFAPVLDAVHATGWTSVRLDLSAVRDKADLMERCASALDLPDWFGRNWDALADCLKDLGWLPVARGRLLLVSGWREYARARPEEWATAQDVLAAAVDHWKGRAEGFAVLLALGDAAPAGSADAG